jgi:hypothetical protein
MEEFLEMKKGKQVREVWLDGSDLYAEAPPDFLREGIPFRFVHVQVPPAYLALPAGSQELMSGVDPSRFHVIRK